MRLCPLVACWVYQLGMVLRQEGLLEEEGVLYAQAVAHGLWHCPMQRPVHYLPELKVAGTVYVLLLFLRTRPVYTFHSTFPSSWVWLKPHQTLDGRLSHGGRLMSCLVLLCLRPRLHPASCLVLPGQLHGTYTGVPCNGISELPSGLSLVTYPRRIASSLSGPR